VLRSSPTFPFGFLVTSLLTRSPGQWRARVAIDPARFERCAVRPQPIGDLADAVKRPAGDDDCEMSKPDCIKSFVAVGGPKAGFRS